jgi:hypothetical protein
VRSGPEREGEIAREILAADFRSRQFLDDAFAAGADEHAAFAGQIGQRAQKGDVLFARRSEADHRVEPAAREKRGILFQQRQRARGGDEFRVGMFAQEREHLGDGLGIDAIDDARAAREGAFGRFGVVGVDRKRRLRAVERGEDGFDARPFLFPRQRGRVRTGRFAADVENIGAFVDQIGRAPERFRGCRVQSAVRKGIGRDVDDSHDLAHHAGNYSTDATDATSRRALAGDRT